MRILFSTFGSLGDIHPYIAIALEAKSRGHEPILATSPRYAAKIESLGISFRPIRPDLPAPEDFAPLARQVMDSRTGSQYLFREVLVPTLRESYADLVAASEDVDLIITHPAGLAGPLAARKLKKKWLSSVLSPISLWSKYDPPVPPTLPGLEKLRLLGPIWGWTSLQFGRAITRSWLQEVYKLSEEEKLPEPGHPIFEGSFSPYGTLALFSPIFGPPQRDWPHNTTATGFCFHDSAGYAGQKSAAWETFVQAGSPPLVFTLGSAAAFGAERFYEQGRQYATQLHHRAILLTATSSNSSNERNPQILDAEYAPYSELFPKAKILIHQGGIGTTAQALRAGVPQIVVPFAHDQPDNAARLRRLGVSATIPRPTFESGTALPIFREFLAQSEHLEKKSRAISNRLRDENGPATACDFIERA